MPQGRASFPINGYLFPESPIVPIQVGQVEEWLLVNTSGIDHVFHIHQTDLAVIRSGTNSISTSPTATGPYRYTSLRDSVDIPPGSSVIIRWRVSPELGKYVFHCHILPHEDGGMMMGVLALPNASQRRFALGSTPGQQTLVVVKDGNGKTAGRVYPFGKSSTRGVATATGELTDDLTEDVVTALRPRSAPRRSSRSTTGSPSTGSRTSGRSAPNASASALRSANIDDQGIG